jgi:hypothetical protein
MQTHWLHEYRQHIAWIERCFSILPHGFILQDENQLAQERRICIAACRRCHTMFYELSE